MSQLAEDHKSNVSGLAPHDLYHRENQSGHSEPMLRIVRGMLGISAFSTSKLPNTPLMANGNRANTSTTSIHPAWRGTKEGKPSHPQLRKGRMAFVL
jgi:hypothetical protein